jgi:hypothetical protein
LSNLKEIKVKEVGLILDKERHLRYDMNALAIIQDKYGDIMAALDKMMGKKLDVRALTTLLWAGLIHEDKELAEEYVGSLIPLGGLQNIQELLLDALGASLPETKNSIPSQTVKTSKKTQD